MRYAKTPPRELRFLPKLTSWGSSLRSISAHAEAWYLVSQRWEYDSYASPYCRRSPFRSLHFLLFACVALVYHIYFSDGDSPSPSTRQVVVARHRNVWERVASKALVVDGITIGSHPLVVMLVRPAGVDSGTPASSTGPVALLGR